MYYITDDVIIVAMNQLLRKMFSIGYFILYYIPLIYIHIYTIVNK